MNNQLLEMLLFEEEGASLDFKREQYSFVDTSDETKSELLKDILGFANAWRREEAYILIGVEDIRGGRANVLGIDQDKHLDDHSLQQFVNGKTNRPIQFSYKAFGFEGKQLGIIRIDANHPRPVFLKKDYGKLRQQAVYVRRGSSTDITKPADPDEIVTMRESVGSYLQIAELKVEFASVGRNKPLGNRIEWASEYCKMPEVKKIPLLKDSPSTVNLPGVGNIQIPRMATYDIYNQLNPTFYRELAEYLFFQKFCKKIRLVISNVGSVVADDVRLEILLPRENELGFIDWDEVPRKPEKRGSVAVHSLANKMKIQPIIRHAGDVIIETNKHETKVDIDCKSLQPGREVWTEDFYLYVASNGIKELHGRILASNLPKPQEFALTLDASITESTMSVEELRKQTLPTDAE
jgi:hypothetical protein